MKMLLSAQILNNHECTNTLHSVVHSQLLVKILFLDSEAHTTCIAILVTTLVSIPPLHLLVTFAIDPYCIHRCKLYIIGPLFIKVGK